jgi:hypothetical protein
MLPFLTAAAAVFRSGWAGARSASEYRQLPSDMANIGPAVQLHAAAFAYGAALRGLRTKIAHPFNCGGNGLRVIRLFGATVTSAAKLGTRG